MERFVKGDIVIIPFPFSDLSANKKRPALVVADLEGDDVILVQITSKYFFDEYSINLNNSDLEYGSLPLDSNIRCNKLFTADRKIIIKKQCSINKNLLQLVSSKLITLFS